MKLWDYLNKEYGLILLESEINDILEIARQEIELPTNEEIIEEAFHYGDTNEQDVAFENGAKWALNKVRNPYPKTM